MEMEDVSKIETPAQDKTLLVVDNNRDSVEVWAEILRGEGYQVKEATSEASAMQVIDQGKFDAAVVDLRLRADEDENDVSGLSLAATVREQSRPAYVISGAAPSPAASEFLKSKDLGPVYNKRDVDEICDAIRLGWVPKVFLVHGHDESSKTEVLELLEQINVRAVVLQELPGGSRSIIEKFEHYTNVHVAVVLMTPDDEGCIKGQIDCLQPRARQNVIFELGFLLAKLGRRKVISVTKKEEKGLEIPSDFSGVEYVEMDAKGNWKKKLGNELRHALIDP